MEFKKYQHIEKIDHPATQGLLFGECYVFPKIDGTNASIWIDSDSEIQCGSRNRHLTITADNAGFCAWVQNQENIKNFLLDYPALRLYGEWLVPHALKTYSDDAWRNFYVFDVRGDESSGHMHYDVYSQILDLYDINYIPPIATIENPSMETLNGFLVRNKYLIQDGEGDGEGIVIKNYRYKNRHDQQIWGKIVTNEFKTKHTKTHGPVKMVERSDVEEKIVSDLVTPVLVEKVYSKIVLNDEWENKFIPKLLNLVFFDLVNEESWRFVKKYKNPTIDFRRLQGITFAKVKTIKPELF